MPNDAMTRSQALDKLKRMNVNPDMQNPMAGDKPDEGGSEFFLPSAEMPAGVKEGDEVTVYAKVGKIGNKVVLTSMNVIEGGEAEEDAEDEPTESSVPEDIGQVK